MPKPTRAALPDLPLLRAWWSHRQGLDGSCSKATAAQVLERTGWARSVGGVGPYLTLHARAGLGRESVDASVGALELHELPSARGCTYVVPASDYALALRLSQAFGGTNELATAKKYCDVTDAEIDKLSDGIVKVLGKKKALDPKELKDELGDLVRSLGEVGKKRGLSTTLPIALGLLQSSGEIRRMPTNGRLDQQRYRYVRWTPNPTAKLELSAEEAHVELARRYFRWTGPATVAEFQWFSALGVKAAKAAIAPLGLVPLGPGDERLLFPEDLEALQAFKIPKDPQYALVSSIDGIVLLRRKVIDLLDPADLEHPVFVETATRAIGYLMDLPSHAILDRGRLIGLWEYDPEAESIAWTSFGKPTAALKKEVARVEAYVRDELGDARSFSLDSPASRAPRIASLRAS